jgi:hypothetical protein
MRRLAFGSPGTMARSVDSAANPPLAMVESQVGFHVRQAGGVTASAIAHENRTNVLLEKRGLLGRRSGRLGGRRSAPPTIARSRKPRRATEPERRRGGTIACRNSSSVSPVTDASTVRIFSEFTSSTRAIPR